MLGNSLVVQWLGLGTFIAGAQVQSLVGELRSHKSCGVAKKGKKEKKTMLKLCNRIKGKVENLIKELETLKMNQMKIQVTEK